MRSGDPQPAVRKHVQRRIAGPAPSQRLLQRIGCTSSARLVLTNRASGFMRARSSAVTMPRVSDQAQVQAQHIGLFEQRAREAAA
jgi:hypothetical protein